MKFIGTTQEISIRDSLNSYVPNYYRDSKVVSEILRVDAYELELLYANIMKVFDEYFVDKITYNISELEEAFGIKVDETKTLEERRSVIKSKLRGYSTSTVEMIKNVAESYLNGEVDVTELNETYDVYIRFSGKKGIPTNLNDIKNAIRLVTPAHLNLIYEIVYLSFLELEKVTWATVEPLTWEQLEVATF